MLAEAKAHIQDCTVLINFQNGTAGSGTLVSIGDIDGILTAHHVSAAPEKHGHDGFALTIRTTPHRVEVRKSQVDHVVVGDYTARNGYREHLGPDLGFYIIVDAELAGRLKAVKTFYTFQNFNHKDPQKYCNAPWIAVGSPDEWKCRAESPKGESLTTYTIVPAHLKYLSTTKRQGFDYIRFHAHSGDYGYPTKYGGMSGGGIWLLPRLDRPYPILLGVLYYATREHKKERVLIGHGPLSIYTRLPDCLKRKWEKPADSRPKNQNRNLRI